MKEVNKENEFERLLKEKADRFETKPAPEVWQQVKDAIQKEQRRRFGWWVMAALLFAVLGTGAFFMLEKRSLPPAASPTAENNSDAGNNAANNSSSETGNPNKVPSSGSVNVNPSTSQNQSDDNTFQKKGEEKISGRKNENENHSVPTNGNIEASEDALAVIAPRTGQQDGNTTSSTEIEAVNSQPGEIIAPLSSKDFPLFLPEETILAFPVRTTSLDFSSFTSSKHVFYLEVNAMALNSFVWNHASSNPKNYTAAFVSSYKSSYSFMKGYSAGTTLLFQKNNKWILGAGIHLSKTHLEAVTAQQTDLQYDSIGTAYDSSAIMYVPIYDTVAVATTQSQHAVNQWLDISLMTGVKLFPDSKNHLRILAGIGYSRLLSNKVSTLHTSDAPFDTNFSAGLNPNNVAGNPFPTYQKNQFHLLSEIAYQRDLTTRLSFTAGMQLHYYPMNLLLSNELSQHMMWVGLKGGLLFRL